MEMYRNILIITFLLLTSPFKLEAANVVERIVVTDTFSVNSPKGGIKVKVSYPAAGIKVKDKIVLWSSHPTDNTFIDETLDGDVNISVVLRKALLDSGYVNIEYLGRNDSVIYSGHKFCSTSIKTRADDFRYVIDAMRKRKELKSKHFILAGCSFGAMVNGMTYLKCPKSIYALLQVSPGATSPKEHWETQKVKNYFAYDQQAAWDIFAFHCSQAYLDSTINKLSSLDSHYILDVNGSGYFKYMKEHFDTLYSFIGKYKNMDSIYKHLESYIRNNWQKEDFATKELYKNKYDAYYKVQAHCMTPEQIISNLLNPDDIYPKIKCPVLGVFGTRDIYIDYAKEDSAMQSLLKKGGNNQYTSLVFEGYDHQISKQVKHKDNHFVEDSVIEKIMKWVASI
jgi:pimeloyl-ACP methyl ester carboxylesterase